MLLMKRPLGMIDTRLTMTDTSEGHILSPSFASILEYNEQEVAETSSSDENRTRPDRNFSPGKWRPRLELEAALDRFYTLDGVTEQQNPQNKPGTENYGANPDKSTERSSAQSKSSPSATPLNLEWLDQSLMVHPSSAESQAETNHLLPELQSSMKSITPCFFHGGSPARETNQEVPLARSVRFSPPPSPKRPLSSVERKRDYIASHKQSKQYAKWKRASPHHSPARSPKLKTHTQVKSVDTRLPRLSNTVPVISSPSATGLSSTQAKTETIASKDQGSSYQSSKQQSVYDMVVINFGVYGPRYPERLGVNSQWAFMRIKMNPTFISAGDLCSQTEETKQIVCRLPAENLLFHFVFVVPAFMIRRPHAFISFVRRLANSPLGLNAFTLLKFVFFWVASLINMILQLFWDMELGFQVNVNHRDPERGRRSSR